MLRHRPKHTLHFFFTPWRVVSLVEIKLVPFGDHILIAREVSGSLWRALLFKLCEDWFFVTKEIIETTLIFIFTFLYILSLVFFVNFLSPASLGLPRLLVNGAQITALDKFLGHWLGG